MTPREHAVRLLVQAGVLTNADARYITDADLRRRVAAGFELSLPVAEATATPDEVVEAAVAGMPPALAGMLLQMVLVAYPTDERLHRQVEQLIAAVKTSAAIKAA